MTTTIPTENKANADLDYHIKNACKRLLYQLLQKNKMDYPLTSIEPDNETVRQLKNEFINISLGLKLYN